MILKRFIYCLSLALPLVLTACSADSADVANPADGGDGNGQRLRYTASVSGETVLTDHAFQLLAWQRDSTRLDAATVVYFDSLWVGSKSSDGSYAGDMVYYQGDALKSWTTTTDYYWPKAYVACDFYAVYPASAAGISVTERDGGKRPVRYINYDNSTANQTDLLLAAMMCDKQTAAANALAVQHNLQFGVHHPSPPVEGMHMVNHWSSSLQAKKAEKVEKNHNKSDCTFHRFVIFSIL